MKILNNPPIPSYFKDDYQDLEIENLFNSESSLKYIGH